MMKNIYKHLLKAFLIFTATILLLGGLTNVTHAQSASIELKKYTNGLYANLPPGPEIQVGGEVVWQYVVTNTGGTSLTYIIVTDNQGVLVTCPAISLDVGDSMICEGKGIATEGQYENIGIVEAVVPGDNTVTDDDISHYLGINVDSDGDGIFDDVDQCLNSDINTTIVIAGCDTGVENILFDDGCTMSDLVMQCADSAVNHGKFVSCVSRLTNQWKKAKIISGKQKGKVQRCAAKSDIP